MEEYKVFDIQSDLLLYTVNLGDEIAVSAFSIEAQKVALARHVSPSQLRQLMTEMDFNKLKGYGSMQIRSVGGDESEQSVAYFKDTYGNAGVILIVTVTVLILNRVIRVILVANSILILFSWTALMVSYTSVHRC